MKNVSISEELFEKLKNFVVDPFDDTIETVIYRLIDITNKARDRCFLPDTFAADSSKVKEELEDKSADAASAIWTKPIGEGSIL